MFIDKFNCSKLYANIKKLKILLFFLYIKIDFWKIHKNMKESDHHNDILTSGPLDVCDIGEKNMEVMVNSLVGQNYIRIKGFFHNRLLFDFLKLLWLPSFCK